MKFYVYILYSKKFDIYYKGQTQDLNSRLEYHNKGYVKSTSKYIPWELKCAIEKPSRKEALILERKLKNLSKERLLQFIQKYDSSQDD